MGPKETGGVPSISFLLMAGKFSAVSFKFQHDVHCVPFEDSFSSQHLSDNFYGFFYLRLFISYSYSLSYFWLPRSVWVQVLNRQQNRLALLEIPVSAFRVISSTTSKPREENFKIRLILEETSDVWINVS